MSAGSKRVEWIDRIKCICILCVIISHLGKMQIAPDLRVIYMPFFLSGFLFASGYVYRQRGTFREHLKRKFRQLFVPWLLFSLLIVVSAYIITFNPEKHQSIQTALIQYFFRSVLSMMRCGL